MTGQNTGPLEDDLHRRKQLPESPGTEAATLLGDKGEDLVRAVGAFLVGNASLADLGPGCDRAPDGTLRIKVDRASFEALGFAERDS